MRYAVPRTAGKKGKPQEAKAAGRWRGVSSGLAAGAEVNPVAGAARVQQLATAALVSLGAGLVVGLCAFLLVTLFGM